MSGSDLTGIVRAANEALIHVFTQLPFNSIALMAFFILHYLLDFKSVLHDSCAVDYKIQTDSGFDPLKAHG